MSRAHTGDQLTFFDPWCVNWPSPQSVAVESVRTSPRGEPEFVVGGGDCPRRLFEEDPPRRGHEVHLEKHYVPGRRWVTGNAAPVGPVRGLLTDPIVGGQCWNVPGGTAAQSLE